MNTSATGAGNISDRLQRASADLKELEAAMTSGDVDPRILLEFREAVNHVRHTTWAVQQWLERREKKEDPFDLVSVFVAERVRIGTQLVHELVVDAESFDLDMETPGIQPFAREVKRLAALLKPMVPEP